ncbi:uncharacterized protein L203_101932 [Cryptococcus depauperatus CBS 7841]|uniref:Uncharacterized protein n=1 Tax=Cryptococcus depauperatus CBS 7841 TaxID=1295531 RepID=A0A1E3IHA1_9TREE|nr:hypothetical protein L203_03177 [Cryptococcus depauperatus CBS 7841]
MQLALPLTVALSLLSSLALASSPAFAAVDSGDLVNVNGPVFDGIIDSAADFQLFKRQADASDSGDASTDNGSQDDGSGNANGDASSSASGNTGGSASDVPVVDGSDSIAGETPAVTDSNSMAISTTHGATNMTSGSTGVTSAPTSKHSGPTDYNTTTRNNTVPVSTTSAAQTMSPSPSAHTTSSKSGARMGAAVPAGVNVMSVVGVVMAGSIGAAQLYL